MCCGMVAHVVTLRAPRKKNAFRSREHKVPKVTTFMPYFVRCRNSENAIDLLSDRLFVFLFQRFFVFCTIFPWVTQQTQQNIIDIPIASNSAVCAACSMLSLAYTIWNNILIKQTFPTTYSAVCTHNKNNQMCWLIEQRRYVCACEWGEGRKNKRKRRKQSGA